MIVVCVDKNREHNKNSTIEMKVFYSGKLTIGKTYEILSHTEHGDTVQWFIADDGTELLYYDNDKDFITLEQHRENQLNQILS